MATIEGTKKKLTVSGEAIESAVNSKHEHSNNDVLDKLSDNNGTLQYNGADITGSGSSYTLPTASETVLGGVKVDGTTITVNPEGIISATSTGAGLTEEQAANVAKIPTIENNVTTNTNSISNLETRVTQVESNGISDEAINQKITDYITENGVLSEGCIESKHFNNALFGNKTVVDAIKADYVFCYYVLDTSKVVESTSYECRVVCEGSFDTLSNKNLRYGFATQNSNENMMTDGTVFNEGTHYIQNKTYSINSSVMVTTLPTCFKIVSVGWKSTLSAIIDDLEIYINGVHCPIKNVEKKGSATGNLTYTSNAKQSAFIVDKQTLYNTKNEINNTIENFEVKRYNFEKDMLDKSIDNSIKWELTPERKGHLIFHYDLGESIATPELRVEYIYDHESNVNISHCKVQGHSNSKSSNNSQELGFSSTLNTVVNVNHTLTATLSSTGRYISIIFNISRSDNTTTENNFINFKKLRVFANGIEGKLYDVTSDNVSYYSDYQKFNDDRIMNFGNYREEKAKEDKYKGMVIRCMGDSTTLGENGATSKMGYPTHLAKYYSQCTVSNNGWNGIGAEGFFIKATEVKDWTTTLAVLSCYGANASGGYDESHIPDLLQYVPNSTKNGNSPIYRSVEDAISKTTYLVDGTFNVYSEGKVTLGSGYDNSQTYTVDGVNCKYDSANSTVTLIGFYFNDNWIDTEDKYWALFGDNWYGRMAKGIEYIQWINPLTTLALHSYHHLSNVSSTQAEDIETYMLKLQEIYRIPVIKANKELGVNGKTLKTYMLDWAHMQDIGNEMKGWYLARQLETYIKYPYKYYDGFNYVGVLPKSIEFTRDTESVSAGSSSYMYVKIAPYNCENNNIIFTTDNENATVELAVKGLIYQKIKVTGVTAGNTTITATCEGDTAVSATATVTVTE